MSTNATKGDSPIDRFIALTAVPPLPDHKAQDDRNKDVLTDGELHPLPPVLGTSHPVRLPLDAIGLGRLLHRAYGITRQRWSATPIGVRARGGSMAYGRALPSGGAQYPIDLYVVAAHAAGLPPGVYRYLPGRHALSKSAPLHAALEWRWFGLKGDARPALALLFVSRLWSNTPRYGAFGYRLQCLDAGVAVGQSLVVAGLSGLGGLIHYRLPELAIDRALGLDPAQQTVFAGITLWPSKEVVVIEPVADEGTPPSQWPTSALMPVVEVQREIIDKGLTGPSVIKRAVCPVRRGSTGIEITSNVLARRRSARGRFDGAPFGRDQLISLLEFAADRVECDMETDTETLLRCLIMRVSQTETGLHTWRRGQGLLPIREMSDAELRLQELVPHRNVRNVGATVAVIGRYEPTLSRYGAAWYRVVNMEAGAVLARVYLACAALGLACDASIEYPGPAADELLQLDDGETTLMQALIGHPGGAPAYEQYV
jgi:SagB-type dehydrogenase family enzyme